MTARGAGSVINITSPATLRPWPATTAYSAAQAAAPATLSQGRWPRSRAADHVRVLAREVQGGSAPKFNSDIHRECDGRKPPPLPTYHSDAGAVPGRRRRGAPTAGVRRIELCRPAARIAVDGGPTVAVPEDWRGTARAGSCTWASDGLGPDPESAASRTGRHGHEDGLFGTRRGETSAIYSAAGTSRGPVLFAASSYSRDCSGDEARAYPKRGTSRPGRSRRVVRCRPRIVKVASESTTPSPKASSPGVLVGPDATAFTRMPERSEFICPHEHAAG